MAKWIALFSQSGSELVEVSNRLGIKPFAVFTNNMDESKFAQGTEQFNLVQWKHDVIMDFLMEDYNPKNVLITLHGYLRILPKNVCEKFNIYNGHPGDIVSYPILKGKDPQQKALDLNLPRTGTVIHKVTPEVDDGEIVRLAECSIDKNETVDTLIGKLKEKSIDLWVDFLKTGLTINENWN